MNKQAPHNHFGVAEIAVLSESDRIRLQMARDKVKDARAEYNFLRAQLWALEFTLRTAYGKRMETSNEDD